MKWKHKLTGWVAQTQSYNLHYSDYASFKYEVAGMRQNVYLPVHMFKLDDNWEEIPDGRWLDAQFTVREFMEAFAMVITEEASGHDSVVAKGMVDRRIKRGYGEDNKLKPCSSGHEAASQEAISEQEMNKRMDMIGQNGNEGTHYEEDWMQQHKPDYDKLLKSGMFFELHPEWTGEWEKDQYAFCHEIMMKNK